MKPVDSSAWIVLLWVVIVASLQSGCSNSPSSRLDGKWESVELHQNHGMIGARGAFLQERFYARDCKPRECDKLKIFYEFVKGGNCIKYIKYEYGGELLQNSENYTCEPVDETRFKMTIGPFGGEITQFAFANEELVLTDQEQRKDLFKRIEKFPWE